MEAIMIKDAAKMLGVEAHVLRYWEDELGLEIKRNSMGHRYYDERDIRLFTDVKELKSMGLTLKDIKQGIERHRQEKEQSEAKAEDAGTDTQYNMNENVQISSVGNKEKDIDDDFESEDEETEELKAVAIKKTDNEVVRSRKKEIVLDDDKIVDFKIAQMQTVMNKVISNALQENKDIIVKSIKNEITTDVMKQFDTVMREQEERQDERYRKLDTYLRQIQQANEEVAATKVKWRFGRRKQK